MHGVTCPFPVGLTAPSCILSAGQVLTWEVISLGIQQKAYCPFQARESFTKTANLLILGISGARKTLKQALLS